MSVNTRVVHATPDQVWSVLADGWLYPVWVVGATRMRDVEADWPAEGSKLHHSAGVWPLIVSDNTEVLACQPGKHLRMRARGWPMGEAEVAITLDAEGGDTRVEIREEVVSGPARLIPDAVEGTLMKIRNTETLQRLAFIAEHRLKN
jgi:uncharacterized protein YndB with AHSA1/START domain